MSTHEPEIHSLMVDCMHAALRRRAIKLLDSPADLPAASYRAVERLMRIAVALTNQGSGLEPRVYLHHASPPSGTVVPPELLPIELTDLLAARAADRLGDALAGQAEARKAIEAEAEHIFATEDIQYR